MVSQLTRLLVVNTLTCGLEICMATGTIYIAPLLLGAGLEERYMTMVLGVGPVLGLVFVPLIGSASDSYSSRFGHRRPFIWALCTGVLVSLLVIPRASYCRWLEVPLLAGGICLMEFCGQACFAPLEALVSDLFPGEEESRWAFSIFSLMVSLGGCVGYLLPAVHWHLWGLADYLGGQEAFIYTLLTAILLLSMLSTMFVSERHTPGPDSGPAYKARLLPRPHCLYGTVKLCLSILPRLQRLCRRLPLVTRRLFVAELCSWMALMTFILFYTDFIGKGLYQGVPSAMPGTQERILYDEGVRMGSMGLFLQCVTSVVFSLSMDSLLSWVGTRAVYLSSIIVLAVATLVMSVSHNIYLVTIMTTATGYTFCVLQVLPYVLTCLYHSDKQVFFPSTKLTHVSPEDECEVLIPSQSSTKQHPHVNGHTGAMSVLCVSPEPVPEPSRGLCLDMAILDSAYMLSQVLPSLCMGYVVQITHSVTTYMACACAFSLLAIVFSRRVIFSRVDME